MTQSSNSADSRESTTPRADAVELYAENHGTGDALVFVHGGWMSGRMWKPQVEAFADDYRVVTVDLRGHGRTGETDTRRYTIATFAADLRRTLDDLDVENPVICGLSLGGLVAQAYAAAHPDEVRGLILADTVQSLPPFPLPPMAKELFPKPMLYGTFRSLGSADSFRWLLTSIHAVEPGPWLAVDEAVREFAFEEVRSIDRNEFVKVFDALYEADGRDASKLSMPTLLLYGDHEAGAVVAQNRRLFRQLPNVRREVIPDAGHLSNRDNPEAFDAAVAEFVESLA